KIIPEPITTKEREITAKALRTEISAISRRYTSIRVLPFASEIKLSVAIAKVLVLIPPPVDAGEAPIHIRRKINIVVEKFKEAISTVLKPAVRGVAAPNNAVTNLPNPLCSASTLSYSLTKKRTVPTAVKVSVVIKVMRLFRFSTHG